MSAPIRILGVDDHLVVRMGLVAVLERAPDIRVIGQAEDGAEALELYRQHRPDVTLMDLRLPDADGAEVTAKLRAEFPDARVLVLSTFDTEEDIHRAMQAGASGYLLKKADRAELLAAIRAVHAGKKHLPAELAELLALRESTAAPTPRQLEVLRLLARGLSNADIARVLGISRDAVKAHLKSLFARLEVSDRTEAVTVAVQRGILRL